MRLVKISREHKFYAFSSNIEPAAYAYPDDIVVFEVNDCFDNQVPFKEGKMPSLTIDKARVNPATGPLWVEGAKPGMTLIVRILDIKVPGLGLIRKWIIPIRNGFVKFANMNIPIRPIIGVIGVAPKEGTISNKYPGDHGGNLDSPDITIGSTVFLPIWTDGGLLGIGDVHAVQGDGEVSGQGLEVPALVTVKISLSPRQLIPKVIVETPDYISVLASAHTLDDACKDAIENATKLLQSIKNMGRDEALALLSMASDLRISQVVNPLKTVRLCIPKYVIGSLVEYIKA